MGGKHKQAQRTKNNARPSSSGRSAELLANTMPHFTGFSPIKETGFSLPSFSVTNIDDIDTSIDSNFQLVLKKMNKKDATTKLKALQEFTDLVKGSDQEAVITILVFWTRLYGILATDAEHKIREATHIAHHQVVLKAKRNLAPYLKQLAGPWFTSQYDTYAPSATMATKSFEDAFPQNKVQEAIVFCQEEILMYVCDNLIVHSAQTLNNPKMATEETQAKYERIVISSLQGYALYLNKVNVESIKTVEELNLKIVSNSKFWKLSKNVVVPIRAAWFSVLITLIQKAPFLLTKEVANVSSSVLGNLDESEPVVLPNVWEAALLTITTLDCWWKHISVEKMLLPKLFKVLRQGGQGNAAVIFPNLLPFLSHISPIVDFNTFYFNFFDNMRMGLKQKSVISSRLESSAISVSILECLQYVILKNQDNVMFCEKLIKTELLPIIEWCLTQNEIAHKSLFNQIATLVQYWHRNRNQPNVHNYTKYLTYFWSNIDSLFQGLMMNMENNYETNAISDLAVKQIEFMMSLKHIVKPKKQLKVQFTTDVPANFGDVVVSKVANDKIDENYLINLNSLVYNTCENYIKIISKKQSKELIEHLFSLLRDFNSESFFETLNEKLGGKDLMYIYNNVLLKWLQSSYLCSKPVIDLVFMLLGYLKNEDKNIILYTLSKLNNEQFGWCVARALSHPQNSDTIVQAWLSNEKVDEFLINIAEKELLDESTPDLNLVLKQAFTETNDGDLFISRRAITQITNTLSKCLLQPSDFPITVDSCASLASYISSILYTDALGLKYGDELLLSLFTLSCNLRVNDETISKDTLWEVNTAWQDAVGILLTTITLEDFKKLTESFAYTIETEFLAGNTQAFNLDEMVNKIVCYVRVIQKNCPMIDFDFLAVFFKRSFLPTLRENITDVCVHAEYLRGNLASYTQIGSDFVEMKDEDILQYALWTHLIMGVLLTPVDTEQDQEDDDEIGINVLSSIIKVADHVDDLVLDLLYDVTLIKTFRDDYKTTKYYNKINDELKSLSGKMKILIENLDTNVKDDIMRKLIDKSASERWLWVKTVYFVYSEVMPKPLSDVYDDFIKLEQFSGDKNLGRIHLTQVFSEHLSFDNIGFNSCTHEMIVTLRCLLHNTDIEVQIAETFAKIDKIKIDSGDSFYEINFSNWEKTQLLIEIINLASDLISKDKITGLPSRHWDFVVVSLATLCLKIVGIKHIYKNVQVAAFISAIVNLFAVIENYIKKLQLDSPKNKYVCEWNELFSQDIHTDFLRVWLYLSEQFLENKVPLKMLPFLQNFESAIRHVDYTYVFGKTNANTPKWSKLLKTCCNLLTNNDGVLQLWGYHMLHALSSGLIEIDTLAVNSNTPHVDGLIFEQFKTVLKETQEIIKAMLLDFKLGEDSCRVEPFTDSYTYTFAYLLIWDVLLDMCEKSSTELRYQYADWLRNEDFLSSLLNNIFKLMPIEVLHYTDSKTKPFYDWFLKKYTLPLQDPVDSNKIEYMVCWLYAKTVSQLPASVRQWWSDTESRIAQVVERVTSAYVSPQLCNQELSDVGQHETNFKNMVVKVYPTVREVIAIYTVEDSQMDLVITLPKNYPLDGPTVQCNRQIGGTSHKQWLMQLKMCVLHQNGSIWDGLSLWNNNLNKKFDGVEECYICFSVLHPGTYQLPKLSCQTCRKKFHSPCLYKWFSTSNKSTCPICRNLF